MLMEIKENEHRERELRIPKANPLPCTTDYPEARTDVTLIRFDFIKCNINTDIAKHK